MDQHGLAWMPTLSGDTQAVLATDKVRFQGQEVAAVIATDPYIARDALPFIDVDYEMLEAITTPQQSLATDTLIRDDKEDQADNVAYTWAAGDQDSTEAAFATAAKVVSLDTHYPRSHPAPLETCGVVADVNSITGQCTIYMTSQAPHAIRTVFALVAGLPEEKIPHRHLRHRRGFRQQGAGLSGVRGGYGRIAADRQAGQMDREPYREPDIHRVRAGLPHARRVGARREQPDHRHAGPTFSRTRAPSTRMRSRPSSGPGCSTSAREATTSRPPTSRRRAPTPTRRPAGWRTGARSG